MNKFLIIGASGLVGSKFAASMEESRKRTPNEIDVDITNKNLLDTFFEMEKDNFDTVVNFAAVTNVDGAEKEKGDENGFIWKLNVVGAKNLADLCKKYDKFLIQISTDFVFTGSESDPGPYDEDHPIPESIEGIGWYGWTKNRAEKVVRDSGCNYAIVRIGYPFYADNYDLKPDYTKGFLKLYDENKLFPIFTDQILTPVLVDDLVQALLKIAKLRKNGVYHVVSSNTTSPFEFVQYLLKKARNAKKSIQKGSMKEFLKAPGRTPRPRLGGFKTEKTQEKLGMKFRTWQEMIDEFVSNIKN